MSLIPLDQQRGDEPSAPRAGPREPSILRRFLSGLKAAVGSLPGVSSLFTEPSRGGSEAPGDPSPESGATVDQRAAATLPGGTSDSGEVEVVSTETEDRLTVEAVDNPDATISSDTWEPVER